jgi:predicted outer membrane repeat protein
MRRFAPLLLLAAVLGIPSIPSAKTWIVPSPTAPTIQIGINQASAGDTVLVKCGLYAVKHLTLKSGVHLISEFADPGCVTLDGLGLDVIMDCHYIEPPTTVQGFTLEDGSPRAAYCSHSSLVFVDCIFDEGRADLADGGAVYSYYSSLTFLRCDFTNNVADYNGGALYCFESDLALERSDFRGNFAGLNGGALRCVQSDVQVSNSSFSLNWTEDGGAIYCLDCTFSMEGCLLHSNSVTGRGGALYFYRTPAFVTQSTFADNAAQLGGSIYLWSSPGIIVENSIFAFGPRGSAVSCLDPASEPTLSCCDVYGNASGDWTGCIEGQLGLDGNISEDPRFCSPLEHDYELGLDSPCAPGNSPPGCGLIGARKASCAPTSTTQEAASPAETLHLSGNRPNPFNPATLIEYRIPALAALPRVVLAVYDVSGRRVTTLIDRDQRPGAYRVLWDGTDRSGAPVASGVYFCRLSWNGRSRTHRMVLLR